MSTFLIDQLVDSLLDIGSQRSVCLMRIATAHGQRMAFFEDGELVYFASDDARESLAAFLTGGGRLSSPDEREAIAQLDTPRGPLVAQILERGLCDADRLRPWLVEYACECFGRAFDDAQGTVKIMPNMRASHPAPFKLASAVLVLEAVRRMTDEEAVRRTLGPLDQMVVPADDHMDRLFALPLNYQEGVVGSQIMARVAIKELLTVSGLFEDEAIRAILALRLSGVIPPFEEAKELTDSGRLRIRKAALESGVAVDHGAAQVALGLARGLNDDGTIADAPLSMSEFQTTGSWRLPMEPEPPPPPSPPPPAPPPAPSAGPKRAGSGQLRVIASVYVQMAESEAAAGNFNGAVGYFEQALREKPGDLAVVLPFAKYLLSLDKGPTRDAAERLLKQACIVNPSSIEPRLALARLYRAAGRNALALEALGDAERIDPDNNELRAMLDGKGRGGLFSKLRGN
jgi:tetratricopeptide (TPR) repeat protein